MKARNNEINQERATEREARGGSSQGRNLALTVIHAPTAGEGEGGALRSSLARTLSESGKRLPVRVDGRAD